MPADIDFDHPGEWIQSISHTGQIFWKWTMKQGITSIAETMQRRAQDNASMIGSLLHNAQLQPTGDPAFMLPGQKWVNEVQASFIRQSQHSVPIPFAQIHKATHHVAIKDYVLRIQQVLILTRNTNCVHNKVTMFKEVMNQWIQEWYPDSTPERHQLQLCVQMRHVTLYDITDSLRVHHSELHMNDAMNDIVTELQKWTRAAQELEQNRDDTDMSDADQAEGLTQSSHPILPCNLTQTAPCRQVVEWQRDLTEEGIEPHPGPSTNGKCMTMKKPSLYEFIYQVKIDINGVTTLSNSTSITPQHQIDGWIRDLVEEGIEPHLGPSTHNNMYPQQEQERQKPSWCQHHRKLQTSYALSRMYPPHEQAHHKSNWSQHYRNLHTQQKCSYCLHPYADEYVKVYCVECLQTICDECAMVCGDCQTWSCEYHCPHTICQQTHKNTTYNRSMCDESTGQTMLPGTSSTGPMDAWTNAVEYTWGYLKGNSTKDREMMTRYAAKNVPRQTKVWPPDSSTQRHEFRYPMSSLTQIAQCLQKAEWQRDLTEEGIEPHLGLTETTIHIQNSHQSKEVRLIGQDTKKNVRHNQCEERPATSINREKWKSMETEEVKAFLAVKGITATLSTFDTETRAQIQDVTQSKEVKMIGQAIDKVHHEQYENRFDTDTHRKKWRPMEKEEIEAITGAFSTFDTPPIDVLVPALCPQKR